MSEWEGFLDWYMDSFNLAIYEKEPWEIHEELVFGLA